MMGLNSNADLREIFGGIEKSLTGETTFAYYKFQGKTMGMQTITSCFVVANANEFCRNITSLLPVEKEISVAIGKMHSRLKDLSDTAETMDKVIDLHSLYVYGPESKKLTSYSKTSNS